MLPTLFADPALLAAVLLGSLALSLGLHLWARRAIGLDDRRLLQLMWLLPLLALAAKLASLAFVVIEVAPHLGAGDAAVSTMVYAHAISTLASFGVVLFLPATVLDVIVLAVLSAVRLSRRGRG